MKNPYAKSKEELFNSLNVTSQGVNDSEVIEKRYEYGFNELREEKKKSLFQIFLVLM